MSRRHSEVDGRPVRIAFATFGCKLNQWDTQGMRRSVAGAYDIVDFDREADLYVINTCTVTAGSDSQARQLIRRTVRLRPGAKVFVTGCYAQRAADELLGIEGVTLAFGNDGKEELLGMVDELFPAASGDVGGGARTDMGAAGPAAGRSRCHVAIQSGCDRGCSYCIVPSVRGVARSAPLRRIIEEVETHLDEGYREIVLTGTYLGDYGGDGGRADLPGILKTLNGIVDGAARLRISSLGPSDITHDLVDAVAGCESICRHFHVAFQSGDDSVLSAMRRGHGGAQVRRALDLLAASFPDCGLGCDVMVGFPGEGEEAFANTRRVLEEYPFSYSHVFVFSPRPGTSAANLGGNVHPKVAAGRSAELRSLAAAKGLEFARRFVGRSIEVIAEGPSNEGGLLTGTSGEYLRAFFEGEVDWKGRLLPVNVDGVRAARQVLGRAPAN
jgi:threonylcarbamoyladenosine tRNA methylthiotransferase MtaB